MTTVRRVISYALALALLALPVVVWAQHEEIWDWWKLKGYSPPSAVSALATQDTMTNQARHVFYVNHPQLIGDVNVFRQECNQSEQTIVLGCYHPPENGIAIYDVQDARLNGVEQVTAAHEMLHAAYERLSSSDKKNINALLQNYYKNELQDKRIADTINAYKNTEPNDVVNEMHSIFGTEVANLPKPLEDYYKRYFNDRSAVVAFANSYEDEFTNRTSRIVADDQKLESMKKQIASEEQSLQAQLEQLKSDRERLDSLRNSNQVSAYNSSISSFNAEVNSYNEGVRKLQANIASYNSLVEARNAVAGELRSLDSALDTRLTTQAAQ
jgi:uncharacterized protein YukE